MTHPSDLNRRELLRRASVLLGASLSAPAVLGVLNGCSASPAAPDWKPRALSESGFATVTRIADIMIPATETPGALDVGVPVFIDTLVADVYSAQERNRYIAGLEEFRRVTGQALGGDFLEQTAEAQRQAVQELHDAAVDAGFATDHRPFILTTKELTLLGYFTSEPGATLVLQYDPLPGAYQGCQPLAEAGDGRTWAGEKSLPF